MNIGNFIVKWSRSGAAERANKNAFILDWNWPGLMDRASARQLLTSTFRFRSPWVIGS
jgi:hypothetical protein